MTQTLFAWPVSASKTTTSKPSRNSFFRGFDLRADRDRKTGPVAGKQQFVGEPTEFRACVVHAERDHAIVAERLA
jgi:hypothetical protein